jgi:serine/threonine protein kinase
MAPVRSGTRLGAYEVVEAIGSGGMGTVYRARDTRLPREAAIKVSSENVSDRFAREDERPLTGLSGIPTSWSRDGRFLLFTRPSPDTLQDVWVLPEPGQPAAQSKAYALIASRFQDTEGQFSRRSLGRLHVE